VSFALPLEKPLEAEHAFFLEPEQEDKVHCPGTAANPKAAPGDLCVYTDRAFGALNEHLTFSGAPQVKDPSDAEATSAPSGAGKSGAIVLLSPEPEEPEEIGTAYGTWAVTAP
jgi:hypothetical protein